MLAGPRGWSHRMCPGLGCGIGWLWEGWGAAVFWPIVSRACTNCWTGLIALVDGCTETGGDCCRVGGVHELRDGGGARMAFPPGLHNPVSLVHRLPGCWH